MVMNAGTGHGVGACLSVHEGPQRISKVVDSTPLLAGMIVSNEPGYYESGKFGIRIENLVEIVAVPTPTTPTNTNQKDQPGEFKLMLNLMFIFPLSFLQPYLV